MLRVVVHVEMWTAIFRSDEPRIVCILPGVHHGKLKHGGSCLSCFLFFTVSNVQAPFVKLEALVNRINDDKSMIMQCVYNPPS